MGNRATGVSAGVGAGAGVASPVQVSAAFLVFAALAFGCSPFSDQRTDAPGGADGGTPTSEDGAAGTDSGVIDGSAPLADAAPEAPSAYRDAVLVDKPLAYWRFGQSSTTTAKDASGHGNDATVDGPCSFTAKGALVKETDLALDVHGGCRLQAPPTVNLVGVETFTFEVWVQARAIDTVVRKIFDNGQGTGAARQELWLSVAMNGGLDFVRSTLNSPAHVQHPFSKIDSFRHVVVVFGTQGARIYVDGVLGISGPAPNPMTTTPAPFYIGSNGSKDADFDGFLDEAAVYDHELTAARILAHHDIGVGQ